MYYVPFGELLTDMERTGVYMNVDRLKAAEQLAVQHIENHAQEFMDWASQYCPDAKYMNVQSDLQKRHLLFAPSFNAKQTERYCICL